ncbi:hypothetical protein GCM10025876_36360 [Demequina litorisediminis]|uniref:ABC transmembrane type-1 domain-containing protein n=1 Tax=Demequina litorisediminis TaxID=1849022 RepID=A0ABQ6IL33_9MICO|nr:hypothetical protein GCM10025876_36360 [Demequina litorisediminis]
MSQSMSTKEMFRRGFAVSPEFKVGLGVTLTLAALAACGRAAVPFVTQRVTDLGLMAPGGVDIEVVVQYAALGAVVLVIAALLAWRVRRRIVAAAETGLATLRIRAFRKVHEPSVLTQNEEQRGRYVSRVTGDVETIRDLMQWTGAAMIISALESLVVYGVMVAYSWRVSLIILVAFVPMVLSLLWIQPRVSRAFQHVRERMADLLARTSEQIVGVSTIRSYGVQQRMRDELNAENDDILAAERRASILASVNFSSTVVGQSLATGMALVGGTIMAVNGQMSVGTVVAMAFLVYQFAGPVMWIIEMLAEMQRALVGWKRVLELVDEPVTVADPGANGTPIPHGRGEARHGGHPADLPGRPGGPQGHRPVGSRGQAHRARRHHRFRQDHAGSAHVPLLRPHRGRRARGRSGPQGRPDGFVASVRRRGASGGLPLRWHRAEQSRLRVARCAACRTEGPCALGFRVAWPRGLGGRAACRARHPRGSARRAC